MQVQLMVALKFIKEGNSMKKARGNKNSKEIKESRKKKKIFSLIKVHTMNYNFILVLSKYIKRQIEQWNELLKNNGYIDEREFNILKTLDVELEKVIKEYKENGFEIVDDIEIKLEDTFKVVLSQYMIDDRKKLSKLEIELIENAVKIFSIVKALNENIRLEEKTDFSQNLLNLTYNFQEYITFFKAEIDTCKVNLIIKEKEMVGGEYAV